jgi:hypothetical protein
VVFDGRVFQKVDPAFGFPVEFFPGIDPGGWAHLKPTGLRNLPSLKESW